MSSLLICLLLVLAAAGCGNSGTSNRTDDQSSGVNEVLEAGMAEEDNSAQEAELPAETADNKVPEVSAEDSELRDEEPAVPAVSAAEGIDVDLTALSSTMVYSEVYSMMTSPEDYIGKTVKMRGTYAVYHDEQTDKYYFACIIKDATACCAQGIEFELTDDYTYPDDYPAEGEEACVVGVFDTYKEGSNTYATLRNAQLSQ